MRVSEWLYELLFLFLALFHSKVLNPSAFLGPLSCFSDRNVSSFLIDINRVLTNRGYVSAPGVLCSEPSPHGIPINIFARSLTFTTSSLRYTRAISANGFILLVNLSIIAQLSSFFSIKSSIFSMSQLFEISFCFVIDLCLAANRTHKRFHFNSVPFSLQLALWGHTTVAHLSHAQWNI